jgi:hypothetical protein
MPNILMQGHTMTRSITESSPASAKGRAESDVDVPAAWKAISQKSATRH